ncbi:putative G-protein coupled receptor 141 [Brachyhypopomus gauderio]|uniref:putative G-protein coupled receptor 141 n=1 Tax=Brachyhypopomus gauderio TaxID=698409 RepID=UPI0040434610
MILTFTTQLQTFWMDKIASINWPHKIKNTPCLKKSVKHMYWREVKMGTSNNTNQTTNLTLTINYRASLLFLYILVLLGGSVGAGLMSSVLKSNMSITTVSVINLLVLHVMFLLTVPFRVYYYSSNSWNLSLSFCKFVSGMIHAHMYLSFIFYIIILIARYLAYFQWAHRWEFSRTLHAVIASLMVWVIILGIVLPASVLTYGSGMTSSDKFCFGFGEALTIPGVQLLNYIISTVVLLACPALACCQLYILWQVHQKLGQACFSHQEFWVQIKSMFFVLIMFLCFMPYHVFRIYYVRNFHDELEKINEVFLAITAFSCFDLLIFVGRGVWQTVYAKCTFCE